MLGQLRDPSAVAILTDGVDRLHPRRFGQVEDRLAHGVVELVADRETDIGVTAVGRERVPRATDIR